MIAIADYGVGNVRSIANMIKRAGGCAVISGEAEVLEQASKLILPGVGAFDTAMQALKVSRLLPVLERKAREEKVPVLGICLGMQLLTNGSEEGSARGLGWIPGHTRRLPAAEGLKIPHMRWNTVCPAAESALTKGMASDTRFYFVHSYYVTVEDPAHCILQTDYGVRFASAIQKENIAGVQFHPEKSHKYGLQLLSNFIDA